MKKTLLIGLAALLCSFSEQEATPLPSVQIQKLNGGTINAAQINNEGKPIILCIWETTCKPCVQEFDNIAAKLKAWQAQTGVKIVAISIDDNRSYHKVVPMVRSKGWPFEFYQDKNQDIKRALGVSYCPFTALLNGDGKILWRKSGYMQGDEDILFSKVLQIFNGETITE